MTSSKRPLIIAGGGTGGHVLAGIAIAQVWKETQKAEILMIGAHGGIETKLVPQAGLELKLLNLGSLKGVPIKKKFKTLFQIPGALFKAAFFLIKYRPQSVIGVGGYASGPVVLMAVLFRFIFNIRVAILEQNAVPGLTNRILGLFSTKVFSAFPGLEKYFGKKVFISGNPVRSELTLYPSAPRRPFTLFIFGGSQGAVGINSLVIEALPLLMDLKEELNFIHQTGERDFQRVSEAYQVHGWVGRIERFIYDMPECYKKASLLICRAGSSTLSEIATVGRASVLIPFPEATDNHQEKNAEVFVKAGAAQVLLQKTGTSLDLARIIREFFKNPALLEQMEKQVTTLRRPNASRDIVAFLANSDY